MAESKEVTKHLLIALAILLTGAGMCYYFLRERPYVVPEGKVLVSQNFIDSLKAVASRPPDTTIVTQTVIQEKVVTIVRDSMVPVYVDPVTGQQTYRDTVKMIDDGINAWVEIMSQCAIDQFTWGYKPVFKTIIKEINIPTPYPVEIVKYEQQRGLYFTGGIGAGPNTAGFSLGLSWQQRNGLMYGAEMVQFDSRYYMLKVGYKIL